MSNWTQTLIARAEESSASSGDGLTAQNLINEAEEHWNVNGKSVLVAWALTAFGATVVLSIFSWRRPKDRLIYQPRVPAHGYPKPEDLDDGVFIPRAPKPPDGLFGWLVEASKEALLEFLSFFRRSETLAKVQTKDIELMGILGLDAMTFIQFLRLLRWLFTTVTICVALPLTLVNYHLNTATSYGSSSSNSTASQSGTSESSGSSNTSVLDNMQLFTAANITGNGLYAHILFEWVASILAVLFVQSYCQYYQTLVDEWTRINCNEIAFKTVMVTNINMKVLHEEILSTQKPKPKRRGRKAQTLPGIKETVCQKIGAPLPNGKNGRSTVTLNHKGMSEIAELKENFDKNYGKLDKAVTRVLRGQGKAEDHVYDSCWKSLTADGKNLHKRSQELVDELDNLNNKRELTREKAPDKDLVTSAFVTVPSIAQARKIVENWRATHKYHPLGMHVQRAPRSKNLIWKNLERDAKDRRTHAIIGKIFLVIICFVNTLPVMAITILANLQSAIQAVPWLKNLEDSSDLWSAFFTVAAGVLPATISAMFSYFLPIIMRFLGKWSGAYHRGQLDKDVVKQLFAFLLVSNFVVFSLLGVLYETYLTIANEVGKESWWEIYQSLGDVPAKITAAYISESSYWLSWYPLRSLLVCVELLQLPRMAMKLFQALSISTGNDLHDWAKPRTFEYAIEYSHICFAMIVAMVYTPLAPIVVMCGTIYFWAASIVYPHQLRYVEDTKESDGKVWPIVINRLLLAIAFMQLLMVLTIALKTKSTQMIILALIPLTFTLLIKWYISRRSSQSPYQADTGIGHVDGKPPKFEHALLKDEKPTFRCLPSDHSTLRKLHSKIPELRFLIDIPPTPTNRSQDFNEKRWQG